MYIDWVPNRQSNPTPLLRESHRKGRKVEKRTLANLSSLPIDQVHSIERVLKGERLVRVEDVFEIAENGSRSHGHVEAVRQTMKRLDMDRVISSRASRERDVVAAMVVARILEPQSKMATSRWWHTTTLPEMLGVADATEDDLYAAMDWVLERQERIEKKLAARHLETGGLALYDLTSSYFEGTHCTLARRGHNRDGKKGKLQVNYGLLTNAQGIPVSVSVFDGNTADPKTLLPEVEKVKKKFRIGWFTIVSDRGMITQVKVETLRQTEGVDWISALRTEAIAKLLDDGTIQMGLFDQRNLFEVTHPDFPGERLIACRNPDLAARRAHKRQDLIEATQKELEQVRRMVERNRVTGARAIQARVDTVLKRYKVGQYYTVDVDDNGFQFAVDQDAIEAELDRILDPEAAGQRRQRWAQHRAKIDQELERLRERIGKGALHGKDAIGLRAGKVLNKYKVGKHFKLDIGDTSFNFEIDHDKVAAEAALDGIYVIRTSLPAERMSADETVRGYKLLTQVERAIRSFKTLDLNVRPIHHRLENRVRAHILLCMLAYYVQCHMMEAWRPLLFADEDQEAKRHRDPVAPAERSEAALRKVHSGRLDDDTLVHSFRTLLTELARITRNSCRRKDADTEETTFELTTPPNVTQARAYDLLKEITV